MKRAFAWVWIVVFALLVPVVAQDRQAASTSYLLIDAAQTRSRLLGITNLSKIRDRLAEAGNRGTASCRLPAAPRRPTC